MASLNKVMLIGNLTRDPEMRFLANGKAMTRIGLAVNSYRTTKEGKRQEETSFFNLVAFEKRAETLSKYCKKGHRLFVDGRLNARTVTNDKGETRTFHDVNVDGFQFLTPAERKDEENARSAALADPSFYKGPASAEVEEDD